MCSMKGKRGCFETTDRKDGHRSVSPASHDALKAEGALLNHVNYQFVAKHFEKVCSRVSNHGHTLQVT